MENVNSSGIIGMKVLSVIMPWPYLIMQRGKDVENRSWFTNYRGRILIHASKKLDDRIMIPAFCEFNIEMRKADFDDYYKYPGCIVGSVELVDCVKNHNSKWAEPDMWHWVLKNPVLLKEPIPARGSLGLWEYKGSEEKR